MILGKQIKAGRILLEIPQTELSEKTGIPIATLRRIENGNTKFGGSMKNVSNIQEFLEERGIRFEDDENAYVVKLLKEVDKTKK
ncbi:MAG: transcriptional regulator with XRE-family HTH domain [Rickettsiales bacterium]|jgi:transcriptional regulator with XRE-family HTH domain